MATTMNNQVQPPLAHSHSSTTHNTLYDALYKIQIPETELHTLFSTHANLSHQELEDKFNIVTAHMVKWLEVAHMTAFTIEQNLKKQLLEDMDPLLVSCQRVAPLMPILIELQDIIYDEPSVLMTKIQSEWSGLQHFINSVKKAMEAFNEKNDLLAVMADILFGIEDLSMMIFQYQEKRHMEAVQPPETPEKEDTILLEIDNRVGPLFNNVEKVYTRMISSPPEDATGLLDRKHLLVQERWECLRIEIDELKIELKEDRWLVVFKQVADQAEDMMDRLDKTVSQCYTMIHQMKENGLVVSTSSSTTTTSNSSFQSVASTTNPMEKLRSVEMNFDAKYKYYTPSVTKMLMMLGNGIAARVSKNTTTLNRHEQMLMRWSGLKQTMDQLRKKDLPDISGVHNISHRPMSPATSWSRTSDRSDNSSTLMKSPEPADRSKSPYISSSPIYFDNEYHRKTPTKRDPHLWHMSNKSPSPVYGRSQQMSPLSRGGGYFNGARPHEEVVEENEDFVPDDFKRPNGLRTKSSLSTNTRTRSVTPSMIPRPKHLLPIP